MRHRLGFLSIGRSTKSRRFRILVIAAAALAVVVWSLRLQLGALLFLPDLLPDVSARPLTWVSRQPARSTVDFGDADLGWRGELYLPAGRGERPGLVIALGVAPAGADDPRVVNLADGLARQGIAVMVPYSPNLEDRRLTSLEVEFLVEAHKTLSALDGVDPDRVGFFGVCVGASLAAIAAADERIGDRVPMVGWFGGYARLDRLLAEVSAESYELEGRDIPWTPDPLARAVLEAHVHELFARYPDMDHVRGLLDRPSLAEASELIDRLPADVRDELMALSPAAMATDITAKVYMMDDQGDPLVPYVHTREMRELLGTSVTRHVTFESFDHMDLRSLHGPRVLMLDLIRLHRHIAAMLAALR